jgi:hypothetical protein
MVKGDLEAAVGMTREWNARDAGREVARNTIKKLKSLPKFFYYFQQSIIKIMVVLKNF